MSPVRLFVCLMYTYSGLHKLHYRYFTAEFAWINEPLLNWLGASEPARSGSIIVVAAIFSAVLEAVLGLLLLFGKTRRAGVVALTAMHIYILLMIGPLGRSYNIVVWPWNVAMIVTLWCLFWAKTEPGSLAGHTLRDDGGRKRREGKLEPTPRWIVVACSAVLVVFGAFPILSFWDAWDAYLSFQLYSGKDRVVLFHFDPAHDAALPPAMTKAAQRAGEVNLFAWALGELNATPVQEERVVLNIGRSVARRAPDAGLTVLISSSPALRSGLRTYSLYAFPGPDHEPVDVTQQHHIEVSDLP